MAIGIGLPARQTANQVQGFIAAKVLRRPTPLNISFEITHRCNLRCRYCDRNKPGRHELSTGAIIKIIDRFHQMGTQGVSLDGGEPLTHPDFPIIANAVTSRGMVLRINTNLTLLPEKFGGIVNASKIKVSLDGDERNHDHMRGKGSFSKVLHGIALVRKVGIPVELTCVLHRQNLDSIPELLQIAEHMDVPVVFQPVRASLVSPGQKQRATWFPEEDALRDAFQRLLALKRTNPYIANRRASLEHFVNFPSDTRIPCAAGWLNCTIDPQGRLFHCGQVSRGRPQADLVRQDPLDAFPAMNRFACSQCWCARIVETNYVWGLQLSRLL